MTKDEHYEALKKFFSWAIEDLWDGFMPDAFEVRDKAEELGLITETGVDEDANIVFGITVPEDLK